VAEGVGRKLNPEINMWHLARPLIEQWMLENLGPGARMRDSVGGVFETIQGLPNFVRNVEHLAESIKSGGLRLHPDSMRALEQSRGRRSIFPIWVPWILVAALAYLLLKR
jgi:ubiquinone biosynthesis protein